MEQLRCGIMLSEFWNFPPCTTCITSGMLSRYITSSHVQVNWGIIQYARLQFFFKYKIKHWITLTSVSFVLFLVILHLKTPKRQITRSQTVPDDLVFMSFPIGLEFRTSSIHILPFNSPKGSSLLPFPYVNSAFWNNDANKLLHWFFCAVCVIIYLFQASFWKWTNL